MSLPSITAPAVVIWNSASAVSFTPAVVNFTPVGCQPVSLASGKPHARSVFTQLVGTAGGGGGGGLAADETGDTAPGEEACEGAWAGAAGRAPEATGLPSGGG